MLPGNIAAGTNFTEFPGKLYPPQPHGSSLPAWHIPTKAGDVTLGRSFDVGRRFSD